ncbi:MAG: hypothetical protein EOP48_18445, partial [Sphingobacteriales bacterium]
MRRNYLLLLATLWLSGCNTFEKDTVCGKINCPDVITSITIRTTDNTGKGLEAKSIEAVNERSGQKYTDLQKNMNFGGGQIFSYRLFSSPHGFSSKGD